MELEPMQKLDSIKQISVIGAGILGHSIAQKFASEGYRVHLCDASKENLEQAQINIKNNLSNLASADLLKSSPKAILSNLHYFEDITEAVKGSDIVIEAVTENLELKKTVLKQIELVVSEDCIIASNASSIVPSEYNIDIKNKSRVLGAHFFNPPHLLPLVELVYSQKTGEAVKTTMKSLLTKIGMHPIGVNKETPGFIGNRLQFALLKEAISIVQEGIATPQEVDKVVKYGFGRRLSVMGPFEVFDFGGWDTIAKVHPNITGEPTPPVIMEKVAQGKYGVKTGEGFYQWDQQSITKKQNLINDIYTYLEQVVGKL